MILPSCFKTLSHCRANVIWPQNCSREEDLYALFRKTFSHNGRSCKVRLFANTYYNLYIDGSFLHRGPVRRHEMHAEFDELNVKEIRITVSVPEGQDSVGISEIRILGK